jgi:hypothetical protein
MIYALTVQNQVIILHLVRNNKSFKKSKKIWKNSRFPLISKIMIYLDIKT